MRTMARAWASAPSWKQRYPNPNPNPDPNPDPDPDQGVELASLKEAKKSVEALLRSAQAQLCALRQYSIDPRSTPVYHKYFMFR